jgi:hypothetical protein
VTSRLQDDPQSRKAATKHQGSSGSSATCCSHVLVENNRSSHSLSYVPKPHLHNPPIYRTLLLVNGNNASRFEDSGFDSPPEDQLSWLG